jgi:aminoglycoside 2''-phosphotransferase
MSLHPWEADRPLTLEIARHALQTCFPEIDSSELRHLGSGWEFDAFLTGDGWVFRFPRRAHCADLFTIEQPVHLLLARNLPPGVALPTVELIGRPPTGFPYRIAGHRYIPGVPADRIGPGLDPIATRDIGIALGAVHGIPEAAALAAGVGGMDVDEAGVVAWVERGLRLAFQLRGLDPVVDGALAWAMQIDLKLARYAGQPRLIHQDLSPDHLIVDPHTGRLTGIIDWTDATLDDPARDFVGLVTSRGWGFAERVLRSYPHRLDLAFRERLEFKARLLSLIWLGEAREQGADVPKLTEWVRNAFVPPEQRR